MPKPGADIKIYPRWSTAGVRSHDSAYSGIRREHGCRERGRKSGEGTKEQSTLPSLLPLRRAARYSTMNTSWLVSATCARTSCASPNYTLHAQEEPRTLDADLEPLLDNQARRMLRSPGTLVVH